MNQYRSLKDLVYDYIAGQIASGKLKPNESISEATICAALDVSRTPVREALMQLSNERYIVHIPRRGFFTRQLSQERVRDIFQIIGNLEALGAALALEHVERLDLAALRRLVDEMEQALVARDFDRYNPLQYQFHDAINQAGGNEDLLSLIGHLKKFFMRQEYNLQSDEFDIQTMLLKMNEEHRQILALIEAGDKEGLRAFLRDVHWNTNYAEFYTFV